MEIGVNLSTEKARRDYNWVCEARDGGSEQAYALLMDAYREPLYAMLLKLTNSPDEADDLLMETFGKAFCQLDHYSPTNAFSTWLFSIATNNFLDHVRKRRMDTVPLSDITTTDEDEVYEYPMPSGEPNPEEAMMTEERAALIRRVVAQLKPRYRILVEMRYFQELSYDEIAEKLGVPLGTVKVRLLRARAIMSEAVARQKDHI